MQTLIVTIEDIARLSEIKTAIERLPGVTCVTNAAPYDATDCDAYHEAMDDKKAGRVYNASTFDDMLSQA